MKKLARAISVIQQGMLRNNPGHVKDSVNEATEVLGGMFNTHKCLLDSGVEFQKRLESHSASKRMGIFRRPRSESLGDTPKKLTKGEKRVALSPPEDRFPKKGKVGTSPTYAAVTRGQTPQKGEDWQLVEKKKKKDLRKREKGKKVPALSAQDPKEKGKLPRDSSAARSGDAIRMSAKDGESYAEILKAMKAMVNPQNAGAEVPTFGEPGGRRSSGSSKRGVTSRTSRRRSSRLSGRRPKLNLWF